MRFIDAYFTDNEKKVVNVLWENDKKEVIEETVIAETNDPAWENLLNQPNVSLDTIHERTHNRNKEQREIFEQQILEIAKREGLWKDIVEQEDSLLKVSNLVLLNEDEINSEDLFKFKLKLFEQEIVSESTDRKLKSELRKAVTFWDAIVTYRKFRE